MLKNIKLTAAAVVAVVGSTLATAAELDDLMDINATVLAGCSSIVAPPVLDMGQLAQGSPGAALDNIMVTCGTGVDYEVAIEGGNNDDGGTRRLNNFGGGTDFIPYTIVSGNCDSLTEVGTENSDPAFGYVATKPYLAGDVISGLTGNGAAQNVPVCAKVSGASTMSVPPDTYEDQVKVLVLF